MNKQTIHSIYSRRDAMAEACRRWDEGNNAGAGYEIDVEDLEGAEQILTAENDREVDVYIIDGKEVGVGDVYGLWAVTL
jgi:hypothetical protein